MMFIKIYKSTGKLFLSALFLFLSFLGFSQNYPLKFGVKAGWNYSNVNAIDENNEPSGYLSDGGELYGGIAIEKQIFEKSYLQSAFLVSYTHVITFLEIPLFYKHNFFKNFSLITGPKIEYIPDEQYNHLLYFKKRFGLSANLGIDYKISQHFNIEGYISKQFVKQYDDNILTYYNAKRNVYRIGLTYFFN